MNVRAASTTFPLANCSSLPQQYGVRASSKSGRAYLTDRAFCQAVALEAAAATGKPFALRNVQEEPGTDLTFSTTAFSIYPPDANTIAAGVVVNLSAPCGANCVLLSDKDGTPAASLSNVQPGRLQVRHDVVPGQGHSGLPATSTRNRPRACYQDMIVNPAAPVERPSI